jgi:hypothetical protein
MPKASSDRSALENPLEPSFQLQFFLSGGSLLPASPAPGNEITTQPERTDSDRKTDHCGQPIGGSGQASIRRTAFPVLDVNRLTNNGLFVEFLAHADCGGLRLPVHGPLEAHLVKRPRRFSRRGGVMLNVNVSYLGRSCRIVVLKGVFLPGDEQPEKKECDACQDEYSPGSEPGTNAA